MKLPVIQRFQKQNYPGSAEWFTRFISDLNTFTETIWNTLNNNITPSDNMDAQVYTTSILAGAAASNNTLAFQTTLKHTPQAVIIVNCVDKTAYSSAFTSAVFATWSFSGTTISITGITGLTNGHTYNVTFLVL